MTDGLPPQRNPYQPPFSGQVEYLSPQELAALKGIQDKVQSVSARRWASRTLIATTLAVLFSAALFSLPAARGPLNAATPATAEAWSFGGCAWTGTCSILLTRWETRMVANVGGAAASQFGWPGWLVGAAVVSAADLASDHGYCLKISYNVLSRRASGSSYRC